MGSSANFRSGKVSYLRFATAGNYFTHATEAGTLRGRMPGTYSFKTQDLKDYAARPWDDATDIDIKMGLMETTFPRYKDIHLLSQGPHNIDLVTPEGEHFAFVPTTNNDYINPNGSEMLGMTYQFKIPNKGGRVFNCNWKGTLFSSQEEWIYANTGVVPAGGSGGSPLGLTAWTYDPEQFVQSNFIYALYDGADMGFFEDGISIELNSTGFTSHRGQQYGQFVGAKITLICAETAAADLLSRAQKGLLDKTLSIYTRMNEQFNFITGAVRPGRELGWDDKAGVRKQTLIFEGEVPYAQIDINTSTKVATFNLA
jgi:hypothetical protein